MDDLRSEYEALMGVEDSASGLESDDPEED